MAIMEEIAEGFRIGFFEPASIHGIIEKLVYAGVSSGAITLPPFPRAFKSAVRIVIGCDRHEFVADIDEVYYNTGFHRLFV